jgi:hypothetical protein
MRKPFFSFAIFFLFLISCKEKIKPVNKIYTVAKITKGQVFTKGGRKEYAYFYKGKLFLDVSSFDARYFTYGDMFLIYIDKTKPENHGNLRNLKKIYNSRDFEKVDSVNYYLDEEDLIRLDSIE